MNLNVVPLFPTPLAIIKVEEDFSKLNEIPSKYKFLGTAGLINGRTESLNILKYYPDERKILLKYFNEYKNKVLKLESIEFSLTTSWITKTVPGASSFYHDHKNCIYSAVFYYDDIESGDIIFQAPRPSGSLYIESPEKHIFNSDTFRIKPEKNMLLIFPSHIMHRVDLNKSNTDRYSLAFNLFPTGTFGKHDSSISLSVNEFNEY